MIDEHVNLIGFTSLKDSSQELYLKLISDPKRLLGLYSQYTDLLSKEDTIGWWQEQFAMANVERNQLRERVNELERVIGINKYNAQEDRS